LPENCTVVDGPLAVTDANVVLRRIIPQYFPQIFGATEDQPLDVAASKRSFEDLTNMVHHQSHFMAINKSKVVLYLIMSIGHGADPSFLAVSSQMT